MTQQQIDDLVSYRDAAARNCAIAVLEGNMALAETFAQRFDHYQQELARLYQQRRDGRLSA